MNEYLYEITNEMDFCSDEEMYYVQARWLWRKNCRKVRSDDSESENAENTLN